MNRSSKSDGHNPSLPDTTKTALHAPGLTEADKAGPGGHCTLIIHSAPCAFIAETILKHESSELVGTFLADLQIEDCQKFEFSPSDELVQKKVGLVLGIGGAKSPI